MQKKNLLLLICVLFSILYVDAKTDFKKIDDLYYNLDATSMKAFVAPPNKSQYDFTKQNGVIKIPSTVVHKKKVYNVVSIGNESFKDCKTLKSIDIPNSVTYIGTEAFYGCSGLTSATIGNSVTTIPTKAFARCNFLTNVSIGNSVTTIGEAAFMGCESLTGIVIPNSVATIEKFAFNGCGFTNVTIGNSVSSIGEGAFMSCNGLTSVVIPGSVTIIDQLAFWHCKGLKSVVIGRSVSKIGRAAFNECANLREVEFNAENCSYCGTTRNIEGIHFKPGQSGIKITGFYGIDINEVQKYVDGKISGYAFPSNLTYLKIGADVKKIPSEAFSGCIGLKEVEFNAENCQSGSFPENITSLKIGDNVKIIPDYAFKGCDGLRGELTIPNSVTSIGKYAFYDCSGLTGELIIPNSVTSIGEMAFYDCSGLTGIIIPDSGIKIADNAFDGCQRSALTQIGIKTKLDYYGTVQLMEKDGQYGIVSTQTGEYIVPLGKYSWINNTRIKGSDTSLSNINPYLTVKEAGELVGLINMYSGKLIIPAQYKSFKIIVGNRWADIIVAWDANGNMSLYNGNGTLLAPSGKYDFIGREHGTYLVVGKNKKKGLIDYTNGKVIFPPKHDEFMGTAGSRLVFADNGNPWSAYVYSGDGKLLTSKKFNTRSSHELKVWLINNGLQNMMLYD